MKHFTSLLLVTLFAWIFKVSAQSKMDNCCSGKGPYVNDQHPEDFKKYNDFFNAIRKQAQCDFASMDSDCDGLIEKADLDLNTIVSNTVYPLMLAEIHNISQKTDVTLEKFMSLAVVIESIKLVALYGPNMSKYELDNPKKMKTVKMCTGSSNSVDNDVYIKAGTTKIFNDIRTINFAFIFQYKDIFAHTLDRNCLTKSSASRFTIGKEILQTSRVMLDKMLGLMQDSTETTKIDLTKFLQVMLSYENLRLALKYTNSLDLSDKTMSIFLEITQKTELKEAREKFDQKIRVKVKGTGSDKNEDTQTKPNKPGDEEGGQNGLGIGLLLLSTIFAVALM